MTHFTRTTAVRGALPVAAALLAAIPTTAQAAGLTGPAAPVRAVARTAPDAPVRPVSRVARAGAVRAVSRTASGAGFAGDWMYVAVTAGGTRGALLTCDPPRGHARAADACAELATAHGDIAALPTQDVMCPMIYAPVTAEARGRWHGRPVTYRHTFANRCELNARTGSVFALDG
ncbi:SSI family serine proteinase inhibitor [Streptomyces mangrovisoli]|uniref:Subtilisin inhibitor domain-containing protein n=1 Tax=Streptomyces mangrovisoli TaxID=1428628 RepID=A0A1J4NPF5_9ACTN|nr:SSI family serine proteinase inhibitor [Streptomyces mangrovisoli]OIJ63054.1 hypothetical protein WN71_036180 [Streptomyces mangrovisoli]